MTEQSLLETLCASAVEYDASDLLLHEGCPPQMRVSGRLAVLDMPPLNEEFFQTLWEHCRVPEGALDHDTSITSGQGVRFRANLLWEMGRRAAVLRRIRTEIPEMEVLGLPAEVLRHWAERKSGIILVCGPTGCGKSTTLAAFLEWMNKTFSRHIVTIEDPVEFVFHNKSSVFTQREVGIDTPSFAEGLRRSLRQNPDVIMLGEIRDEVSATTAIQASETGHLVLATLHSATASETMERLDLIFLPEEREAARKTLGDQLIGILCQRLLPSLDQGVVLLCEYFTNEGASRKMITEGRTGDLNDHLRRADPRFSRNFLQGLVRLVHAGKISEETALSVAESPQELSRALRGITSTSQVTRR